MRALSACLTTVLGLGLAAMVACSSTASDTGGAGAGGTGGGSTAGTSAGGSSAGDHAGGTGGGTAGTVGAAGDMGAAGSCSFSDVCAPCIAMQCPDQAQACVTNTPCEAAYFVGSDSLLACACESSKTPPECAQTFSDVNAQSKAVAQCAAANCKTECGL